MPPLDSRNIKLDALAGKYFKGVILSLLSTNENSTSHITGRAGRF